MIYVINITESNTDEIMSYRIFDTCSGSTMIIAPKSLHNLILNTNIKVVNAKIYNNRIVVKNWVHEMTPFKSTGDGGKYTLLATRSDNTFKIVDYDGTTTNVKMDELKELVKSKAIKNCSAKLEMEDIYEIHRDEEFEKLIESKYNSFRAKASLLGMGQMDFRYEIENHEVRFRRYSGSSEELVLPSFITSIRAYAFMDRYVQTVKLNEGLKVIGARAFVPKDFTGTLERIEIPTTVELVGSQAFIGNDRLVSREGKLHTDRVKLLSERTNTSVRAIQMKHNLKIR